MKISELIEILKQYPQHQDVMITCGNCNHGHIWYEGQPVIVDHTDQTYGYIDIQILTSKNLGSTFRLVSDGKKVLEQDCIIPRQEKPKEEPPRYIRGGLDTKQIDTLHSWGVVMEDLQTYFIDENVYEVVALDEWREGFIREYRHLITTDCGIKYMKCPIGYSDLFDMMLEYHRTLLNMEG